MPHRLNNAAPMDQLLVACSSMRDSPLAANLRKPDVDGMLGPANKHHGQIFDLARPGAASSCRHVLHKNVQLAVFFRRPSAGSSTAFPGRRAAASAASDMDNIRVPAVAGCILQLNKVSAWCLFNTQG